MRAIVGAGQANDLFNDLGAALKAGKLQGDRDHLARTPLLLDAEGERKVQEIAKRATREVEDAQRAAAGRIEQANGGGAEVRAYTFALLAFEAAWRPADLRGHGMKAGGGEGASANGSSGAGERGGKRKRGGRKAGARS